MSQHFTGQSPSALLNKITSEDRSPHVVSDVIKRANTVCKWVERNLQTNCPPYVAVRCEAELNYFGYLTIWAEASHEHFQRYVDAVVDIAMRASKGCCEFCDRPGAPVVGEGWLTTLCNDCVNNEAPVASLHPFTLGR